MSSTPDYCPVKDARFVGHTADTCTHCLKADRDMWRREAETTASSPDGRARKTLPPLGPVGSQCGPLPTFALPSPAKARLHCGVLGCSGVCAHRGSDDDREGGVLTDDCIEGPKACPSPSDEEWRARARQTPDANGFYYCAEHAYDQTDGPCPEEHAPKAAHSSGSDPTDFDALSAEALRDPVVLAAYRENLAARVRRETLDALRAHVAARIVVINRARACGLSTSAIDELDEIRKLLA